MRVVTGLIVAVFLFVSFVTFAADEKANFSGQWILNTEKSQLGEGGRWAAKSLKVTQEENNLSVERTATGRNGEDITFTQSVTLDGKESLSAMPNRPQRKSTANWSEGGKILTISSITVFEQDGNKTEMSDVETWALSGDGNSLSINNLSQSPRGEREATYVYDKNNN